MDYVEAGKVIRLAPQDSIVLGYMKSCVEAKITGGTITVGVDQSDVQGGEIERRTVACDAGKMLLTVHEAVQAAGLVLRGRPPVKPAPKPQFTLYGACGCQHTASAPSTRTPMVAAKRPRQRVSTMEAAIGPVRSRREKDHSIIAKTRPPRA